MARRPSRLLPRLLGARRRVRPLARLARRDPQVARAWFRNVRAVALAMGEATSDAYTAVVEQAAARDAELARFLAHALPDHLARVEPRDRARFLALLRTLVRDRPEAAALVARALPDLLRRFRDDAGLAQYVARGVELLEVSPARAESFLRMESGEGVEEAVRLRRGLALERVRRTLTLYARAHCGETVQVLPVPDGADPDRAFTDGRSIFLPAHVDRFGDDRDFLVYRVLTARAAGHLEFGTLDLDLSRVEGDWPEPREDELEVERLWRAFPNRVLARDLFLVLENARVEACVREEYPGVARDMDRLAGAWRSERPHLAGLGPAEQVVEWLARRLGGLEEQEPGHPAAREVAARLAGVVEEARAPGRSVEDTARLLRRVYPAVDALLRVGRDGEARRVPPEAGLGGDPGRPGGGAGQPGSAAGSGDDYSAIAPELLGTDLRPEDLPAEQRAEERLAREILREMRRRDPDAEMAEARRRARRDGASYEEMADFLERMPPPAGPASLPDAERRPAGTGDAEGASLDDGVERAGDVFLYPEWDERIGDHKPAWVRLTEYRVRPGTTDFVERVRDEHGPLVARVRRAFEALRPQEIRRVRGLPDGDEIDIDRAVEARVERRAGGSPSDRVYTRHLLDRRDVSVAFLLDLSSSTNEVVNRQGRRVIDVEKEALVLIAEAVDAIGDAFAIYGFSGYGREQVAFYVAKAFEDPWNDEARARVGRLSWKMENRDGAAIRHATRRLLEHPARVRLLLLLSDGKPLDCGCDHYSDRYAQDDTRAALREARAQGVHPFCITVDPRGADYLRHVYGEGAYTVIDRVEALPRRLPLIYRRLTR